MKIDSLNEYCRSMFELLNIPMIIYHKKTGKMETSYFFGDPFPDTILSNPQISRRYLGSNMFDPAKQVSYYISDDKIAFGSVNDPESEYALYIGPCLLADPNEEMMHSMLTRYNSPFRDEPERYYEQIYNYIRKLPRFTENRFLWLLSFSNNFVNHTVSDPADFYQVSIPKNRIYIKEETLSSYEGSNSFDSERSFRFIEELKTMIRNGSADKAMEFWNGNGQKYICETMSMNPQIDTLRYAKDLFFLFVSNISESLSDLHIRRKQTFSIINGLMGDIENCLVTQQIEAVYRKAVLSFTSLVKDTQIASLSENPLIQDALSYIHDHISESISAEDIASHIGISRGYLSSLFNREMKMKISDYVNRAKIDVAKSLLSETNSDIVDIANYLSFSSQSHFHNIFRKESGMTPLNYRRTSRKRTNH